MDSQRGRRHAGRRHHRSRAGVAGRSGVHRTAREGSAGGCERSLRGGRIGESRLRYLCASRGRDPGGQLSARRRAREGERGCVRELAVQAQARECRRRRQASRRSGVYGCRRQGMRGTMKMDDLHLRTRRSLAELEQHRGFVERHIGTTDADQAEMLSALGVASRAALVDAIVPTAIRSRRDLALPAAKAEQEALDELKAIARKNHVVKSFIGQGYYGTFTPAVILRNVLENPAWYTAYTPYQPEISQGRLEALINFQTMVCDLTGLAVVNASMLDEATAAAEAMMLCRRVAKNSSMTIHVAEDVLPQTIDVVRTRARPLGITVSVGPAQRALDTECFAALLQYPGADGDVRDYRAFVDALHAKGALAIC